jgi:hypothetical protein
MKTMISAAQPDHARKLSVNLQVADVNSNTSRGSRSRREAVAVASDREVRLRRLDVGVADAGEDHLDVAGPS